MYRNHTPCGHDPRRAVHTADGELVCRCGVVLEERIPERSCAGQQGRVSLYHQVEVGGSPQDMKAVSRRIHVYHPHSSEFSNICGRLGLPGFVQSDAWHVYRMLRSQTDHTRAKCAMFAVYVSCRRGGQPVPESEIRATVSSVLGVRHAPNILAVISELHEDAKAAGIDSNEGHSPQYYLNMEMSSRQGSFADPRLYERFRRLTCENFGRLTGNHQNRARRAAALAISEMGA